jgi:hypothetical protein
MSTPAGRGGAAAGTPPRVLTFDPAAHLYRVDGAPVPSVTELLEAQGLTPDYTRVPWRQLKHARERGIHVDACCDLYDAGDLDWTTVHPEALPYVEAWARWCLDEGYRPIASQVLLYHPVYGYAGTADSIGWLRGTWALVERKATARMARSYALQAGGYGMPGMWTAGEDGVLEPAPWDPPARIGVHLQRTGDADPIPYDDPEDFAAFLGVVALTRWSALGRGLRRNGRAG